jgi:hypothetical protein
MIWKYGLNKGQEFLHPLDCPNLCICRNRGERHWVIYDNRGKTVKMVPNPNPSELKLTFAEVTDIPAKGEQFGDRPHHDRIEADGVNYAFDSLPDARAVCEEYYLSTPYLRDMTD